MAAPKPSRFPSLSGVASWYGKVLGGHRTASGERFDPGALTACHRSLPFGTLVRVVNLINHRSVMVRINDRGLMNNNRVIDLSSAAAEQLDMLRSGVAPVRLEIVSLLKRGTGQAQPTAVDPDGVPAAR